MAVMRYKGYAFPYNPKKLEIKYSRNFVRYPLLGSDIITQENQSSTATVDGWGSFFGADASSQLRQLESLFKQGGMGQLVLPNGDVEDAYFASLSCTSEAGGDVLDYAFSFVLNGKSQNTMVTK